ncbi:hypothetical protein JHK87_048576 [Glycine soja]|nr:hypothetical protein JHK87_048576 [Glycine soja]
MNGNQRKRQTNPNEALVLSTAPEDPPTHWQQLQEKKGCMWSESSESATDSRYFRERVEYQQLDSHLWQTLMFFSMTTISCWDPQVNFRVYLANPSPEASDMFPDLLRNEYAMLLHPQAGIIEASIEDAMIMIEFVTWDISGVGIIVPIGEELTSYGCCWL